MNTHREKVFEKLVQQVENCVTQQRDVSILFYGAPGTGKTTSIRGVNDDGLLPRLVRSLFRSKNHLGFRSDIRSRKENYNLIFFDS